MVKTCGVRGLMNAESHTNLYVVSPCSFLQRLVEKKKGGDKGGEISFSAESNSFLQTFPLMEMRGVRPRRSKKKKKKKNTLTVDEEEREKKNLSVF